MRFSRVRLQTDCRLGIFDSFWHPPLVKTANAHVQQRHVVIGCELECLLKMRRGFIEPAAPLQGIPQRAFYGGVRRGDCERVLKQSEAVTPPMNLRVGKSSKNQHNHVCYCSADPGRNASLLRDVR